MANNLTNLSIDEVSLVDDGANPLAHIKLFKRKGLEMTPAEIQKALETSQAENAIFKALDGLQDQERAFYKGLGDGEKADFLKMTEDARKTKMGDKYVKAVSATDLLDVTKKLDDVTKQQEILKADIAKKDDTIAKRDEEIVKLKSSVEDAGLRAEVEKKYPQSKGTTEEKMAVLKSIKAMPDENVRKSMLSTLDTAEAGVAALAKEKGASSEGAGGKEAKDKLDEMAKALVVAAAAKGEKMTSAQAVSKALDTEEGKKLYAEMNK